MENLIVHRSHGRFISVFRGFNIIIDQIQPNSPIDYQSLSALCNYYDLPHFTKDFKRYCGSCPSAFHIEKFHFLREVVASKALMD